MRIKEFIDTIVLDKDAYEVGRVSDIDFNKETGKIETSLASRSTELREPARAAPDSASQ